MFLIELPVKNFLFSSLPIFVRVMGIIHAMPSFNCELPFMFFAMNTWWKLVRVQYFCLEVIQVRLAFYLQYIASCVYYRLNHTRLVCKICYSIYTSGMYHICRFQVRSSPCDFFFLIEYLKIVGGWNMSLSKIPKEFVFIGGLASLLHILTSLRQLKRAPF